MSQKNTDYVCTHIRQYISGPCYRNRMLACCACWDSEQPFNYRDNTNVVTFGDHDHELVRTNVRRNFRLIDNDGNIIYRTLTKEVWWPRDVKLLATSNIFNLFDVLSSLETEINTRERGDWRVVNPDSEVVCIADNHANTAPSNRVFDRIQREIELSQLQRALGSYNPNEPNICMEANNVPESNSSADHVYYVINDGSTGSGRSR